jgi:site-specific recombinase XerD
VVARWAHNPKVAGSNPAPATNLPLDVQAYLQTLARQLAQQMFTNFFQSLGGSIPLEQPIPGEVQNLVDCVPLWVSSLKARHQSPRTITGYEADVRNYLKHDPQPTFLSIQGYIARRLDEVSPARVASERKALVSFFKFMHKSGLVPDDPTAKLDSFRVNYKERELPTRQDIDKLLGSDCYHKKDTIKFRTMTLLLANTGLRLGEACTIKKADIKFDSLEIRVMGKGRKQRVVPISEYVAQALKAWIDRDGHSEWLFPADNAAGYWDERNFEKTFKRQCKRYGVKPFTPHALRHYFATHSLRNGARLEVVSRILGHASVSITADIYTHIDEEEIHDTHRRFSPFADLMPAPGRAA